jgi:MFS transporter, NNP family, nitrate/nitrite transporter
MAPALGKQTREAMSNHSKANRISLFNFTLPQMRAFHMTWIAFFLCFFGWFGIAPLTSVVQRDLQLTDAQIANSIIASVAATILARLIIGYICDRFGPRKTYAWLLIIGALPVMGIALAYDYTTFMIARLAISTIGASFVVTQYHTSQMFAYNCVGAANATAAGWGNMGAGFTNMVMPLILAGLVSFGFSEHIGWRVAMLVPGVLMIICGIAYYFLTQDTPAGNLEELRKSGQGIENTKKITLNTFIEACKDYRVWALFVVYGACFGIEIIIHNSAARYFEKTFTLDLKTSGLIAGGFGALAIFARGLGGYCSDVVNRKRGLGGRAMTLAVTLFCQGLAMLAFARATSLTAAVVALMGFGLFVHMAAGATYALIPFINKKALGSVAGIVGAGGNTGAVLAGLLLKVDGLSYTQAIFYLGVVVLGSGCAALFVRFSAHDEQATREEINLALAKRSILNSGTGLEAA